MVRMIDASRAKSPNLGTSQLTILKSEIVEVGPQTCTERDYAATTLT